MTWLLHDSKGQTLDKCVIFKYVEERQPGWKSCAWTEGMCTLGVQGFRCPSLQIFRWAPNQQGFLLPLVLCWQGKAEQLHAQGKGMAKRGGSGWCPHCCSEQGTLTVLCSLCQGWGARAECQTSRAQCEQNQQHWTGGLQTADPKLWQRLIKELNSESPDSGWKSILSSVSVW